MTDIIFLLAIGISVLIGVHMIAKPDYHAKRGTGAFGKASNIRTLGAVFVTLGIATLILRSIFL